MFNYCVVFGSILEEPEHRIIEDKISVITFPLKLERRPDRKDWIRVMCRVNQLDVAYKKLYPGNCLMVSGYLCRRTWQTNDGTWYKEGQLIAMDLEFEEVLLNSPFETNPK